MQLFADHRWTVPAPPCTSGLAGG